MLFRSDYDAVVCDVMMPRVGGEAFYNAVVEQYPHLANRILFISGAATIRSGLTAFISRTENRLLEKPFDVDQLRAALHELLRP